ncbi:MULTISPECIES: sulfurtransferase TusA family protein [unclassified Rhizobium]|uniref:sulfurtransferase TusA family protein n=1 Tax=unclassified Rhizobium TaxID=2613769 RepID=UPI0021F7702B|nr:MULTISPECIES: sulfurtransferase TusA family protein [unclassified Rhizobium]MCV9944980.1 sulfurtransferase TusA family protein [Rhizobium sp. BT-175]MCW0019282.1 sulfurtransferase TusA family protein [Rhizobium sp. BT-226]
MKEFVPVEFDAIPELVSDNEFRSLVETYTSEGLEDFAGDLAEGIVQGVADVRGRRCPYPVRRMNKMLNSLQQGERLLVLTDDPVAKIDVRHAVRTNGDYLRCAVYVGSFDAFLVEKGGAHMQDREALS